VTLMCSSRKRASVDWFGMARVNVTLARGVLDGDLMVRVKDSEPAFWLSRCGAQRYLEGDDYLQTRLQARLRQGKRSLDL
jgi:hypothetical protein